MLFSTSVSCCITQQYGWSNAEVAANILICLIHQTNYLLDQQIRQLEKAFLEEGGLRERMTRARLSERAKQNKRRF
jgi:four helix bundle suffix protein